MQSDEGHGGTAREGHDVAAAAPREIEAPAPLAPISAGERIASIDVLRGVALLGILVMNIPWMAQPESWFFNPMASGEFEGRVQATWLVTHLLFDQKMMSIFSMLFGAGVVVMSERAAARGRRGFAGIHYARMGVLLAFGLVHAYLIWAGDILFTYALCGLVLYPVRRLRAGWLLAISIVLLVVGSLLTVGSGVMFDLMRDAHETVAAAEDGGPEPADWQRGMAEGWLETKADFVPTEEMLAEEREAMLGGYGDVVAYRAPIVLTFQVFLFPLFLFWRAAGMMLLGMALMKWGVFTARRPAAFYWSLVLVGYAVGLPVVYAGAVDQLAHEFDFVRAFKIGWQYNYFGSILVALGHVGVVMLVCKAGLVAWLTGALAAVGRMALTNYLAHSVICTTIFYGYGFGAWGSMDRAEQLLVVAAIWVAQLVWSPLWLRAFRFGPAEWLWRSLSYARLQPMRRRPDAPPSPLPSRADPSM